MQKTFEFSVTFVLIFFGAFTFLGVFGLLPADLQNSINSNPIRILSWQTASSTDATDATQDASVATAIDTGTINAQNVPITSPTVTTTNTAASGNTSTAGTASSGVVPTADSPSIQYTPSGTVELPVRIVISAIGLNDPILNPNTTDADIFESDLQEGVVRWPTSAPLNTSGNIFLFGHSSYLKVVYNKHYQSFNGIQNLKAGDEILLEGPQTTSIYQVATVSFLTDVQANINVGGNEHQLILSTCNVLQAKEDRIVVVSNFVSSYQNSN